jgi:hypothetical protein
MLARFTWYAPLLTTLATIVACGDFNEEYGQTESEQSDELGTIEQAVVNCGGDDSNALAASLAVAAANELGRWDATADFELRNGTLELSQTGEMRCGGKCPNLTALLRLQDDVSSVVNNHNPAAYRAKLNNWYRLQQKKLTELVRDMLTMDKGVYRLRNRKSGRYLMVDNASMADDASVEQRLFAPQPGADQWRVVLEDTKHRFVNVRSGKCLALSADSADRNVSLVQRTCAPRDVKQQFDFAQIWDYYAITTNRLMALTTKQSSVADDVPVVQDQWSLSNDAGMWYTEKVGAGPSLINNVATAMYYLVDRRGGKAIGVDDASMAEGASIETGTYAASEDRFHWYVTKINDTPLGNSYQLINRRSGKCMGLLPDKNTLRIVQKTCLTFPDQLFYFVPTGDGSYSLYTSDARAIQVQDNSTSNEVPLVQAPPGWNYSQQFYLEPILAGEPHRLKYSNETTGAACGTYYWYDIAQPNGWPLRNPADSFVQLIFAGGKETATGADANPYVAQQVNGNRVAIDPTYGLNETANTSTGACSAACTKITTASIAGGCCTCAGKMKKYSKSSWNTSTYLCQ